MKPPPPKVKRPRPPPTPAERELRHRAVESRLLECEIALEVSTDRILDLEARLETVVVDAGAVLPLRALVERLEKTLADNGGSTLRSAVKGALHG